MRKFKFSKKTLLSFLLIFIWIVGLTHCDIFGPSYDEYVFEWLDFPFANPGNIERMAAFGIPNWSGTEPHNGIDLIIYESLYGTRIISPTNGTIDSIDISENPYSHPESVPN